MPAVTPAANTNFPSLTTLSSTEIAPNKGSKWNTVQCVVARLPLSRPAAPHLLFALGKYAASRVWYARETLERSCQIDLIQSLE